MHDWGDEDCVKILKNCRKAIPEKTGKVIVVEVGGWGFIRRHGIYTWFAYDSAQQTAVVGKKGVKMNGKYC